jgi:hypothetical protein
MAQQTPKEKAEELIDNFSFITDEYYGKDLAILAVDEILKLEPRYPSNVDWDDVGGTHKYYYEAQRDSARRYWEQVRIEIKNK